MNVLLPAIVLAALAPLNAAAATLFAADQAERAVVAVDAHSGKTRRIGVPIAAHNVEACGNRVYAVGSDASMDDDMPGMAMPGRLVEIDPQTSTVTRTLEIGDHPAHVVCDGGAHQAFVTLAGENAVAAVDLAAFRVLQKIPVGKYPHGLRMSRDGRTLFVANARGKSLSVVDVATRRERAEIALPGDPVQVAVDPRGRYVYATLGAQNEVVAVDLVGNTRRRVVVGRNPVQLGISPDGRRLVVANQGTRARPDDRAMIVDVPAMTIAGWVRMGRGPHGVAFDTTGRYAYVTCEFAGTIAAIDVARRRLVATYAAGADPNGITFRR